jgi:hypothetical protein
MSIYAVNGKEPIAAWIPSLDDAGNGTTTLTDLVGDKNGTLTNFALTGSTSNWVADTNAGGIRALDFDGTNDNVNIGNNFNDVIAGASARWSVSAWVNLTTTSNAAIVTKLGDGNLGENTRQFSVGCNSGFPRFTWFGALDGGTLRVVEARGVNLNGEGWSHVAFTFDATIATVDAKAKIWVNGVPQSLTIALQIGSPASIITGPARFAIGASIGELSSSVAYAWRNRIDDVRLFGQDLVDADVEYLATRRGVVDVAGNAIDRRKRLLKMRGWR